VIWQLERIRAEEAPRCFPDARAPDAAPCPLGPFPDIFTVHVSADALRAVGATVDVPDVTPRRSAE
jgi:hypothetical protein